jgi:hypothetical protein
MSLKILTSTQSRQIAEALKAALQKVNIAAEFIPSSSATDGRYIAVPLPFNEQVALANRLQLHSKVVSAHNRVKGGPYEGVAVSHVTNLANYHTKLASKFHSLETYSKAGFADAGKQYQEIYAELATHFAATAKLALSIAAASRDSRLSVVTRPAGKYNPQLDAILAEVVESHVKQEKKFEKVAVTNVRLAQVANGLVVTPEKYSVIVSSPEGESYKLANIVVGLGGGKGVTPVTYFGSHENAVYTASNNAEQASTATILSAARYLEAQGKANEAKKLEELALTS